MDRYPYLGTLYYLTSVYLRGIGTLFIFFIIILYIHSLNAYQVFGAVARENWCFMLISILSASLIFQTFFYVYICVVFEFLILFVFILHKFLG